MTVLATANARALGTLQAQGLQQHIHNITKRISPNRVEAVTGTQAWALLDGSGMTTDVAGGPETRPVNAAYCPRIHA